MNVILQIYGALSSNYTLFTYTVPSKADLLKEPKALTVNGTTTKFSVTFTLLRNEVSSYGNAYLN